MLVRSLKRSCWFFIVRGGTVLFSLTYRYFSLIVVESHPDNVADLRIDSPFPELASYATSFNFNTSDTMEFGHIPYVAILLKYMEEWKQAVSV